MLYNKLVSFHHTIVRLNNSQKLRNMGFFTEVAATVPSSSSLKNEGYKHVISIKLRKIDIIYFLTPPTNRSNIHRLYDITETLLHLRCTWWPSKPMADTTC